MSLRLSTEPINGLVVRIISRDVRINPYSRVVLFLAAMIATLDIGFRDARADYLYEVIIFALAAGWCWVAPNRGMNLMPGGPLILLLAWGFFQLLVGSTVYRYATLQGSLRSAALAATAWCAFHALQPRDVRVRFLRAFAWFGTAVAVISVLAYFTSPGKILWTFDAPYPDVWGSFLSRNNFAQFLELAMPVALWFGFREPGGDMLYTLFAAVMVAAGLASASRAGSVILMVEACVILWIRRRSRVVRRMAPGFVLATIILAALPGIGHLAGRLTALDPYEGRRDISRSTLEMIAARPWSGFGLGTFPTVYPAYAALDMGQTVGHAHNDWLEWAAEGGIFYASIWLVLAIFCARRTVQNLWGLGVLGCFVHAAVDFPFARFGISGWVFILIGLLAAEQTGLREVRERVH